MRLLVLVVSLLALARCQYDGESNRIDAAVTFAKSPATKISGEANEEKAQESVEVEDEDGPPKYARPESAPGITEEDSLAEETKEIAKPSSESVPVTKADPQTQEPVKGANVAPKTPSVPKKTYTSRPVAIGYPIPPTARESQEDSPLDDASKDFSDVKSIVVSSPAAPTSVELKNTPLKPYSNEVSAEGSGSSESSSESSSSESDEEGSGSESKEVEHEPSPPEYVRPSNAPGVPKVEKEASNSTVLAKVEPKTKQTLVQSNPVAVEKGMSLKSATKMPPNPPNIEMMKILKGILGSMGEVEDITMPENPKSAPTVDSKTGQNTQKSKETVTIPQIDKPAPKPEIRTTVKPKVEVVPKQAKGNVSKESKGTSTVAPVSNNEHEARLPPRIPPVTIQEPKTTPSPGEKKVVATNPTMKAVPQPVKPVFVEVKSTERPTAAPLKPQSVPEPTAKPTVQAESNQSKAEGLMDMVGMSATQMMRIANAMAALEAMAMFSKPSLTSTKNVMNANGLPLMGTWMGVPSTSGTGLNIPTQKSGYASHPHILLPKHQKGPSTIKMTGVPDITKPKEEPSDISGELSSVGEGEEEMPEDDPLHFIKPDRVNEVEAPPPPPKDQAAPKQIVETFTSRPKMQQTVSENLPKASVTKEITTATGKTGMDAHRSLEKQEKQSHPYADKVMEAYSKPRTQKVATATMDTILVQPRTSLEAGRYVAHLPTAPKRLSPHKELFKEQPTSVKTPEHSEQKPATVKTAADLKVADLETLLVMSRSGMAEKRLKSNEHKIQRPTVQKTPEPNVSQLMETESGIGDYESVPSAPPVASKIQATSTFVGMTFPEPPHKAKKKDLPQPHDLLVKELWLQKIKGVTPRPDAVDAFVTAPDEKRPIPGVTLAPEKSKLVNVQTAQELVGFAPKPSGRPKGLSPLAELKNQQHLTREDQDELEILLRLLSIEKVDMDVINKKIFRDARKIYNSTSITPVVEASNSTEAAVSEDSPKVVEVEGSGESAPADTVVEVETKPETSSQASAESTTAMEPLEPHLGAASYDETAQLIEKAELPTEDNSTTEAPATTVSASESPIVNVSSSDVSAAATTQNKSTTEAPITQEKASVVPLLEESTPESPAVGSSSQIPEVTAAVEGSGSEADVEVSTTASYDDEAAPSSTESSPAPPKSTQEPTTTTLETKEPGYEPEAPSIKPEATAEVEGSGESTLAPDTEATATPESTLASVPVTPVNQEPTVAPATETTVSPESTTVGENADTTPVEETTSTTAAYGEEALAEVLISPDQESHNEGPEAEITTTAAAEPSTEANSTTEVTATEASTEPAPEKTTTTLENIQTTEVILPEVESIANFSQAHEATSATPTEEVTVAWTTLGLTEATPTPASSTIEAIVSEATSSAPEESSESTRPSENSTTTVTLESSTLESIEPSGYEVARQEESGAAVGYAGISDEGRAADQPPKKDSFSISNSLETVEKNTEQTPTTINAMLKRWTPYTFDCNKEIDEKGPLCKEWAEGGLCEINKPTMFLFCRRTCLCTGPQQ